ncbi:hypothetical protein [Micromonospora sp. ATA51]|uniref:hypothetical protein n=1 Tax=Micromonospora sp. ATA51 TaxID=2806098 RepID=UPI001A5C5391|nr:hypothetical protein [Micromonospora sp. ATA51]MBM0229005.1 hypothetical protein [Micromonospora sp. ATA51]
MDLSSIKERYLDGADLVTRDEFALYADRMEALPAETQLAIFAAAIEGRDLVQLVEAAERAMPEPAQTERAGWLDENDNCTECGEHWSGPCAPGCPRGEPADECDARPAGVA